MIKININTKEPFMAACRNFILGFDKLPKGLYELVLRKPTRTLKQNSCIHALFGDLAIELNGLGVPLTFGKGIEASWTEITAKEIFFKTLYLAGKKTSKCTTKELADAVRSCLNDVNSKGGTLAIKDESLTNLLKNN